MIAFEQIWKAVQKFRKLAPFFLDFLLEDEYKNIETNLPLKKFLQSYDEKEILDQCNLIDSEIESHRIYIPALIWQLYDSYRLICIRPIVQYKQILTSSTSTASIAPWAKDSTLHTIIVNLLDEKEFGEFNDIQTGQLSWILNRIEVKLLDIFQKYLSGDILLADMSEKAILLDKANRKAEETFCSFRQTVNIKDTEKS